MKIKIEAYNKDWPETYKRLKAEIEQILAPLRVDIRHFGSTAVPGLAAKPVIDILIGIQSIEKFPFIVEQFTGHGSYIYYRAFDKDTPGRRLFVRLSNDSDNIAIDCILDDINTIPHQAINDMRIAHVHVWEVGTLEWLRHIAFRDYLIAHPKIRDEYADLKMRLGDMEWTHGMECNDAKNDFIKKTKARAINWYNEVHR